MPLFHVRHRLHSKYLYSQNYEKALERWRSYMSRETGELDALPVGVDLIDEDDGVIIDERWYELGSVNLWYRSSLLGKANADQSEA